MRYLLRGATVVAALVVAGPAFAVPVPLICGVGPAVAENERGAPYYSIELVPTGRVPGTRQAQGEARVSSSGSPFGVAVTATGNYSVDLMVDFRGLKSRNRDFAVWVANAELSEIHYAGVLDDAGNLEAKTAWNKFLVIVTLEPRGSQPGDTWTGPVVFRGMSRSGRMHTMAGHGPFQAEACAKYGY